jgi:hypothetical protein
MGVSLSYSTMEPVRQEVRQLILAEANRLRSHHDWWCEPIIFFDLPPSARGDMKLEGDTKLFLDGWTSSSGEYVEVEHMEEYELMVRRDAKFILGQLQLWSEQYRLNWVLEMADTDYGGIVGGRVSPATIEAFKRDGIDVVSSVDEEEAQRISKKYSSRGRFSSL